MKRAYVVEVLYQSKGNRYELVDIVTVIAGHAGHAANLGFRKIRERVKGNNAKRIREVLGGQIKINVTVAERVEEVKDDDVKTDESGTGSSHHVNP